jgi:hypothetical protein
MRERCRGSDWRYPPYFFIFGLSILLGLCCILSIAPSFVLFLDCGRFVAY